MIKAVLDTNVWISALFWRGAPHRVVQTGLRGSFIILISIEIIEELKERLLNKFHFPLRDTIDFLEIIALNSHIVESPLKVHVVKDDPTDNKIIGCALTGGAQYIVSGDHHLLRIREYRKIKIVSPAPFLNFLQTL
ncbi:MAG: putative toxin-antitoxin system toxin component, PIN family [Parcubacteria group bacterium]|nr:putative toxin-antitoxin system toxin component, PIN family [Parcubacteria group bacterium]